MAKLAALRASNLAPPLVSRLDLEAEDNDPEEGPAPGCPGCANLRQHIQVQDQVIRDLRQEVLRVSGSKNPHQSFFSFTLIRNSIRNVFLTFSTAAEPTRAPSQEKTEGRPTTPAPSAPWSSC